MSEAEAKAKKEGREDITEIWQKVNPDFGILSLETKMDFKKGGI